MNENGCKMTEIVTTAQMRALEAAAMESGRVTGYALMQRAGAAVIAAVLEAWPDMAQGPHCALVMCGPGNNGGDGYVIADGLCRFGWTVGLCATRPPAPGDAARAAAAWEEGGGQTQSMDTLGATLAMLCDRAGPAPVLVVDALLGIGQTRNTDAILAPFRNAVATLSGPHCALRHVAVDVPTGYDSDTGEALAAQPFPADLVVTFHARKPVHGVLDRQGIRSVVVPIGL